LVKQLAAQGIHLSYPDGRLRAAPHYWTAEHEIDLLIDALTKG
jgi:cysteine desulfurase / selenocysteine lyase